MNRASIIIVAFFLSFSSAMAGTSGVAKVIIMRGDVKAKEGEKVVEIKQGMWLQEGAVLRTQDKSFAKLLFVDKSSMNLGPNSQMKIEKFPRKEAGVITLMKGQLRSKVTKNYMDIKDKDKSKLFIKTKSAAMGVRGTDFQVNYNPANEATSLVTFHGAVAMAKLVDGIVKNGDLQRNLEKIVSGKTAVIVKKGQYSGVTSKHGRATIPVKISPAQLNTMKQKDTGVKDGQAKAEPKKQFRNVIPPGVNAKAFANSGQNVDKVVVDTMGATGAAIVKEIAVEIKQEIAALPDAPPPEGMFNQSTGELAPTAGGYVDMQTALYVPPPPGSSYDANAEVYVPPPEMGYVDPATGDFTNDHYVLNDDGQFVEKTDATAPDGSTTDDGRTVASVDGEAPPPPPPGEVELIPQMDGAVMEGDLALNDPIMTDSNLMQMGDALLMENEINHQEALDAPDQIGTTRTNFSFTIQ